VNEGSHGEGIVELGEEMKCRSRIKEDWKSLTWGTRGVYVGLREAGDSIVLIIISCTVLVSVAGPWEVIRTIYVDADSGA
jgi:hypothetical protein